MPRTKKAGAPERITSVTVRGTPVTDREMKCYIVLCAGLSFYQEELAFQALGFYDQQRTCRLRRSDSPQQCQAGAEKDRHRLRFFRDYRIQ